MATEFHALGVAYRPGKNKGYVLVRFAVSGTRVLSEELLSPEPEAIHFAAARLKAACADLIKDAREDAETAPTPKESKR